MAVIRVNKTKDYTIMCNYHLREKEMSLKAKGLLSVMLSLPDDWDYSITGLVKICKENESAIKTTLSELKQFGYLKITKLLPNESNSGRIEYIYDIYEFPKQEGKKQGVENQPLEIQPLENQGQLNTNILNTKDKELNNIYIKERKKENADYDKIINSYTTNEDTKQLLYEWLKVRKMKKALPTNKALELNLKRLEDYANQSKLSINKYLEEVIIRGWLAFYPIENKTKQEPVREERPWL